jgi:hypothetical protein
MDDFIMYKVVEKDNNIICQCEKIPSIVHELSQSLVVMHSYLTGCIKRIQKDNLEKELLLNQLDKTNKHLEIISQKIHQMI